MRRDAWEYLRRFVAAHNPYATRSPVGEQTEPGDGEERWVTNSIVGYRPDFDRCQWCALPWDAHEIEGSTARCPPHNEVWRPGSGWKGRPPASDPTPAGPAVGGETERLVIHALREALERCGEWFDEYAAGHRAKGSDEKAARNQERANFCYRALASTAPAGPAVGGETEAAFRRQRREASTWTQWLEGYPRRGDKERVADPRSRIVERWVLRVLSVGNCPGSISVSEAIIHDLAALSAPQPETEGQP